MPNHSERWSRRNRQYRVRTLMISIALAAVILGFLRIPGAWLLVVGPLVAIGIGFAVMLVAMALGWLGFALFALADRLVGWAKEPQPGGQPR